MATGSSDAAGGAGRSILKLKAFLNVAAMPEGGAGGGGGALRVGAEGCRGRRGTIDLETESLLECRSNARRRRGRGARHHRDRVVRTLRRAVETTNTRRYINVDVAV